MFSGITNPNKQNRLASETSLYLRQHGANPVDWYPWGEEAHEKARQEKKPIFLSVGYASCHWCHVMERECFEDQEVATYLNEHFVSIKVDREERPDVDKVYMTAVQALTGGGGWPMSVFLTPDLRPFYGGTYYPKAAFLELLRKIKTAFELNGEVVDQQADSLKEIIARNPLPGEGDVVGESEIRALVDQSRKLFDTRYGGFRAAMKFPTPVRWQFLLHAYRKWGGEELAEGLRRSLDGMAGGGLFDQLGGGFHRYTVDASWTVPHFEKMLYDNAQLTSLFLEAAAVFGEPRYERVARWTMDFLIDEMMDPEGGFYASFDADSEGVEGLYYVWTPEQISEVAGEEDGEALCRLLDVTSEGNFEGANVLTRRRPLREIAQEVGRSEEELESLIDRYRQPLLEARARRTPPTLDRKIILAWNGLTIQALAKGYRFTGEDRYLEAAERAADTLHRVHMHPAGFYRTSESGSPGAVALLEDVAFFAAGCLELYEATGEAKHLRRAGVLIDTLLAQYAHDQAGFYQTASDSEAHLGRQIEVFDNVEPSGVSIALQCLWRYAAITGDEGMRDRVLQDLAAYRTWLDRAGLDMAAWWDLALLAGGPFREVVITERETDEGRELLETINKLLPPYAVCSAFHGARPPEALLDLAPPLKDKQSVEGSATVFVCEHGACQEPTREPQRLLEQLRYGWCR